jgi:CRP-like cAMP-binding protein
MTITSTHTKQYVLPATVQGRLYPCESCPLRSLPAFREAEPDELEFLNRFKKGELLAQKGSAVLVEGSRTPHLYTLLSGWGFRFKLLEDGRRQILNYLMPGDLIGLQGSIEGEMQHSIEMLSDSILCVFDRSRLLELYRKHPGLGYDITWLASREERMLDENLLSVGRRSAMERAAYLIAFIHERARCTGLGSGRRLVIPVTQQHVADTLGLSLVHTNKTLRKLSRLGMIEWQEGGCRVINLKELMRIAGWEGLGTGRRPLV